MTHSLSVSAPLRAPLSLARRRIILLTIAAFVLFACENEKSSSEISGVSPRNGGHPPHSGNNTARKDGRPAADTADTAVESPEEEAPLSPSESLSAMLKAPLMVRFTTPGHVRHSVLFDAPVESISWSAEAGFTVSSGAYVHNVTTRGQERWKLNAGTGHQVYVTEGVEIIWSQQFESIFQMKRHGRVGWKRPWPYPPSFQAPDTLYLVDAANVSRLGGDGRERWRVTVNDVRKLEGPFTCDRQVLFQGKRGQKGVATVVSDTGAVVSEGALPFGAVVLGASFNCEPIIWSSGNVALVGERGEMKWSYPLKNRPLFFRLFNTYLFIVPDPTDDVSIVTVDKVGTILYKRSLPISGRVTGGTVIELSGLRQTIALCKDVSSPCARRDGNRGPYNVLLTGETGQFTVLERLVKGHNNIAPFFNEGFVYAGSSSEDATNVTMYDSQAKIIFDTILPGRLSAGPYVGPYGGVYVGTCMGWDCRKPYRFIAITGAVKDGEDTDEK